MNKIEKAILNELTGGASPRLCLQTDTRIDTGRWWRKSRLWLLITEDQLIVIAAARRRYVQKVKLSECLGSSYCHASGELVIAPYEELEYDHIAMSPANALRVLKVIGIEV